MFLNFRNYLWVAVFLISGVISNNAMGQSASSGIGHFKIEVENNFDKISHDIICNIYHDSLIVGIVPQQVSLQDLVVTFEVYDGKKVLINGVEQQSSITSNDFSSPIQYSVEVSDKVFKRYKVQLVKTGLPVVYINTSNPSGVITKEEYINGQITILSNSGLSDFTGDMKVKGRGNSTWKMAKKPYKLKLNSKASILGMPKNKTWVLLANYADKTLLRTSIAMDMGRQMNLAYTPRFQHVELVLNGEYQGNYQMGEQIEIAEGRVDIDELDEEDIDDDVITGGYLLEIDERLDEDFWFKTSQGVPVTIKSPEDINDEQKNYISNYVRNAENVLFSEGFASEGNDYSQFFNIESFIDWFWVNELFKNTDANFFSSCYMYKERNGKLNMGPLWDFDISGGNVNYYDCEIPSGWWVRDAIWIKRMFKDPAFKQAAENRWNELKLDIIPALFANIDAKSEMLKLSQEQNFKKWQILDIYVWPNAVVTGSYDLEVEYLKAFLKTRISWIDQQINPTEDTFFTLSLPEDNSQLDILEEQYTFNWNPSSNGVTYKVMFDLPEGDFTNPLLSVPSELFGYDTLALIDAEQLWSIVNDIIPVDANSLTLKWTVFGYADNDSIVAVSSYNIAFEKDIFTGNLTVKDNNGISFYPNPVKDDLTIVSENMGIKNIDLIDIVGNRVDNLSFTQSNGTIKLNLSNYSKGVYFVKFITLSNESISKKIFIE
jgi:hypothetical protein